MQSTSNVTEAFSIWMQIYMPRSLHKFLLFSKESGLPMSNIGALFRISHGGSCGINDIGDELGVTSAAASQLVDRLVQQGLVIRKEDPRDRRLKQIDLTDKGHQTLEESIHARQAWMDDLVDTMSDAEREQVTAALNLLIQKAFQLEQTAEPEPEL